jgi:CHAT domain-containing protein/tetratricopeptide (TPR) repeat protein
VQTWISSKALQFWTGGVKAVFSPRRSRSTASFMRRGARAELIFYSIRARRLASIFTLSLASLLALSLYPDARSIAQTTTTPSQDKTEVATLSPVERELKGGETHSYQVRLTSGQFLYALVEQKGIDVVIALYDPSGKQIAQADSPNDQWGTEPVLLVAEAAGDYRVQVSAPNSKAPAGKYEIRIISSRPATKVDEEHAMAQKLFEEGRKLRGQQTADSQRAAIQKYKEALPLFESAGDVYRQALTFLSIGITHARLNEFRVALEYFNSALELARKSGDRRLEAGTETFLGGMDDVLGNVKTALDHYNRALTLSRESQNRSAEAATLNNIGKIYSDMSDWQKALEYYLQALALNRSLGNQRPEARTLQNIGVAFLMMGEPRQALNYFQPSITINRTLNEKNVLTEVLMLAGNAYYDAGDTPKAFENYNQSLALAKEQGNRALEANTLDRMGTTYFSMGDPQKALDYHLRALDLRRNTNDRRREAISLNSLGYVYNQVNQPAKAIENFNQALVILRDIGDLNNVAVALQGLAQSERLEGNLDVARQRIEESLSLIETVRARAGSQQLRASYLASMERAYDFNVSLLMELHGKDPSAGFDAEALRASERGRARSLLEMLNEAQIDVRQGVGSDLIARERELSQLLNAKAQRQIQLKAQKGSAQEIAALDKEISTLEDEYRQTQVAIRKNSPQYAALTQPQPLGLKEIQQQLDQDTVLLEYSLGDQRSYAWVVTPNSLKTFELPKREQIETSAREVYQLLTNRSIFKSVEGAGQRQQRIAQADAQLLEASRKLSEMILSPMAIQIGTKRLVILADGALQYVPFAALQSPKGREFGVVSQKSNQTPDSNVPLIVDHEIVSMPSASALAIQRNTLSGRKPAPKDIAVIADPVFSASDVRLKANANLTNPDQIAAQSETRIIEHLADESGKLTIGRLPFTRQEADQILAVAPKSGNLKAIDFKANRAIATSNELSKYRYVHFATHGYLDSDRPDLSAIVLSLVDEKGKPQDGFLRAHDIYNLNLPAELVVLSACQTGLGKQIKGEGLVGLTQGFMYAGARRVLVSLWNVNDKATAELMQRFYRHMLKDTQSPAAALRAAQVEMWKQKQWQSPYYWAAFTLQGEWR